MEAPARDGGFRSYPARVEGPKVRERAEKFKDNFSQATLFWQSMSEVEQQHIVEAFHFELGKVETKEIRQRMVELVANVDRDLAARVAEGIGVTEFSGDLGYLAMSSAPTPSDRRGAAEPGRSAALSMQDPENLAKGTPKGRKVAVLAAEGVDAASLMALKSALRDAGAQAEVVSKFGGMLSGAGGDEVTVDKTFVTTGSVMYDAVLVPGGAASAAALTQQGDARHFVSEAFKHCKPIAALGEGVDLLAASDLAGVTLADGEGGVTDDSGVVTSRSASDADAVARQFIDAIAAHRHWGRAQKERVPA
jgi:catalase